MATNTNTSWERIQQGVRDTERLIGQKDYNSSMIKARQTLEFMVKQLAERAGLDENNDLKTQIDLLYQDRRISKSTCEHYHKIRMIGNAAVHDGDANPYNANQAYHMLSQEVYAFADTRSSGHTLNKAPVLPGTGISQSGKSSSQKESSGSRSAEKSKNSQASSRNFGTSQNNRNQNSRNQSHQNSASRSASSRGRQNSRKRPANRRQTVSLYNLLKFLVPVLCLILLFFVIKLVKPKNDPDKHTESSVPPIESMVESLPSDTGTEPSQNVDASPVYKTTDTLNVRPNPTTEGERIGQIPAGTTVEYIRAHDDKWAVILYNGQEAYVASQYLTTE